MVAEGAEHLARITEVRAGLDELNHVWSIADNAVDVLTSLGERHLRRRAGDAAYARRPRSTSRRSIYTSGTTGRPKGCMLTHGNFMFELGVAIDELDELFDTEDASTLLFLPLAHVFARIIQVGCVKSRTRLGHSADIKNLVADLQEFQPTFVLAVPRVFEKVFNTASQRATADGRGKIFDRAAETAIAYSRGLDKGRPSLAVRAQHAVFDRLVYGKLRDALGGALRVRHLRRRPARRAARPLLPRHRADRARGLRPDRDHRAPLTVNLPEAQKVGTVGRPIPGTAVRVADDGELLFRGGQVFAGYWGNEEATAEVLEPDGWFHTGDVGEVDDEGFVRITGRKKEILVTAGGKNVAPAVARGPDPRPPAGQPVHGRRRQPAVHRRPGDHRPRVVPGLGRGPRQVRRASPTWSTTPTCAPRSRRRSRTPTSAVSKAESIRKFTILPDDWTEEGGQLTPSLKLKRNVVMRECRDEIEALYL